MVPAILFFTLAFLSFTAIDSLTTLRTNDKHTSLISQSDDGHNFDTLSDALATIKATLLEIKKPHMIQAQR